MSLDGILQQADKSVSAGNFALAHKLLAMIFAEEPSSTWAHLITAKVFLLKKDTGKAREHIYVALRTDPNNAYAFYLLARADYDEKDYAGAYGWATKAQENEPDSAEYTGIKSIIQLQGFDNIAEARQLAKDGLALDPDNVTCLMASYYAEAKAGNQEVAGCMIKNAIQRYPDDPHLHALLAGVLIKEGNRKAAYESIMTALKQVPGSEKYQKSLKNVLAADNVVLLAGRKIMLSRWFQKLVLIISSTTSLLWAASLFFILFQQQRPLIVIFVLYNVLFLLLTMQILLAPLSELYIFVFKQKKFAQQASQLTPSMMMIVVWSVALMLVILSFVFGDAVIIESFLSAALVFFILVLVINSLRKDYRTKRKARYVVHGWSSIVGSCIFLWLLLIYPQAGFELTTGYIFLAAIFYSARRRWAFDEKYDLSKTISANEQ